MRFSVRLHVLRSQLAYLTLKCPLLCLLTSTMEAWLVTLLCAIFMLALHLRFFKTPRLNLPPGPLAFPIVGSWLQIGSDLSHHVLADLAKKYGDVFLLRMGQRNVVVVSSPDLAKDVLHTRGIDFGCRSRNLVFDIFSGKGKDMVFAEYGEHWRKMRRIISLSCFTNKALQRWRSVWDAEIDAFVQDIRAQKESATTGIVPRLRIQLMMYNIIHWMLSHHRFESLDDPLFLTLSNLDSDIRCLTQRFGFSYGDFFPMLSAFIRKYLKECRDMTDTRHKFFMQHFIEKRKRLLTSMEGSSKEDKCTIDYLLESQAKGEIDEQNLLHLIQNINGAGVDTTAVSIEWVLAELVKHPEIQQRVRVEVESVLGKGVQITEPDLPKLPFLCAVVKETLRYHPTVPLLLPHMNLCASKLGGYDIPAESKVLVNAWWLAHNPKLWKDPHVFRPDRFIGSNVEASGNDFSYIPFGAGRRGCPGIVLALPVLSLVIGRLVTEFELLPPLQKQKLDLKEKAGAISLYITNQFAIVFKPRSYCVQNAV